MTFKQVDSELVSLRSEFKALLKTVNSAVAETADLAKARKRLTDVEKQLSQKGDSAFTAIQKTHRDRFDRYFGDMGMTKRGVALNVARSPSAFGRNLMDTLTEDAVDMLIGKNKAMTKVGAVRTGRLARVFGADKFIAPDSDKPDNDNKKGAAKPGTGGGLGPKSEQLLEKIESNTKGMLNGFKVGSDNARRAANENALESKKNVASVIPSINDNMKDKTGVGKAAESFVGEEVAKIAGGTALGSMIARFIPKGALLARAAGIAGAVIMAGMDAAEGWSKSQDWSVSKISGAVGGILGGTDSGVMGALSGAGKFALAGATIGMAGGPVGAIAGALIGAVVGGVAGFIGGEAIAKAIDTAGKAIGETVDKWFGTQLALDPEKVKAELEKLGGQSKDRLAAITTMTAQLGDIDKQIAKARADGDAAQVAALEQRKLELKTNLEDLSTQEQDAQKRMKELEGTISDGRRSVIGKVADWFQRNLGDGFNAVVENVFGVTKEDLEKRLKDNEARLSEIKTRSQVVADEIEATVKAIQEAEKGGDVELANKYRLQLDTMYKRRDELKSDAEAAQDNIDAVLTSLRNANSSLYDRTIGAITDSITGFAKKAGDWVKDIFTWEYWFGQANKKVDGVKDDVKAAREEEARRGKMIAQMKDESSRWFSAEDPTLKKAIKDYEEKKLSDEDFVTRVKALRDSTDSSKTRDETDRVLSVYGDYRSKMLRVDPNVKSGKEEGVNRMTEANVAEDQAERDREARRGAALVAPSFTNNSNVTNNNSTVMVPPSPFNYEPSFMTGVAGTRQMAYAY